MSDLICVIGTGGKVEIVVNDDTQSFYASGVSILSHPDDIHLRFGSIGDPDAYKDSCEKIIVPAEVQVIIPNELVSKLVSALSRASMTMGEHLEE